MAPHHFLVVEDQRALASALQRALAPLGTSTIATTRAGGLLAPVSRREWSALFLDVRHTCARS
jgi:hypothetical protein